MSEETSMSRKCRLVHLVLVLLFVSSLAHANSVVSRSGVNPIFTTLTPIGSPDIILQNIWYLGDSGGTIIFNPLTGMLTMTSTLTLILAGGGGASGDLGTVTFTTGPLASGSILGYATFQGGTFSITTNGTDGLPNGVFMSGALGQTNWHENGNNTFYMFARISGGNLHETSVWIPGTNQFTVIQGAAVIPEPSTVAMVGTGLLAVCCGFYKRGAV
jgi:hypothetical protein